MNIPWLAVWTETLKYNWTRTFLRATSVCWNCKVFRKLLINNRLQNANQIRSEESPGIWRSNLLIRQHSVQQRRRYSPLEGTVMHNNQTHRTTTPPSPFLSQIIVLGGGGKFNKFSPKPPHTSVTRSQSIVKFCESEATCWQVHEFVLPLVCHTNVRTRTVVKLAYVRRLVWRIQ